MRAIFGFNLLAGNTMTSCSSYCEICSMKNWPNSFFFFVRNGPKAEERKERETLWVLTAFFFLFSAFFVIYTVFNFIFSFSLFLSIFSLLSLHFTDSAIRALYYKL
ncbi:hypothetical protein IC582_020682 [Cucumis melo]